MPPNLSKLRIGVASLFIIQCSFAPLHAQNATPKREPVAAPIVFKPGAFLEKDYKQQERDWAEKHLVLPAEARWQGQPWAADAGKFCRTALDAEWLGLWKSLEIGSLAPEAKKLLTAGCDDPLVAWLAWLALSQGRGNWRDGEAAQTLMGTHFPDATRVPGGLAIPIAREMLALAEKRGLQSTGERRLVQEAIARAMADDSYDASSEPVMVRQCIDALDALGPSDAATLSALLRSISKGKRSEWAKNTLLGLTQKHAAWAQRGDGWASDVTQEGWQGFAASLQKARGHLETAWKLRPDRPEPAMCLIIVSMGEGSDILDQRLWFDRATTLQPDYYDAYRAILKTMLPRWNGSHEILAQFGAACADSKRYDTWVPYEVYETASRIGQEVPNLHKVLTMPEFGKTLKDASEGYLAQKGQSGLERKFYASHAAVIAYLMHEPELCSRALEAAGPELNRVAIGMLHNLLGHEAEMRIETDALMGKLGPEAKDLLLTAYKRDRNAMRAFLEKTKTDNLSPDAKVLFDEFDTTYHFEERFNSGDWVPLPFRHGLTNCGRTRGKWSATDKGELTLTGGDTMWAECFFRHGIGSKDVEIRGEILFDIPDKSVIRDGFGFGPMLGWTPDAMGGKPGACALIMNYGPGQEEVAHVVSNSMDASTGPVPSPFKEKNTFHLSIHDGKVTYVVNDKTIANASPLEDIGMDDATGFLGFTGYRLPWGAKATVRNVEVRICKGAPSIKGKTTASAP